MESDQLREGDPPSSVSQSSGEPQSWLAPLSLALVAIVAMFALISTAQADEFTGTPEFEGEGIQVRATDARGNLIFPATFSLVDDTGELIDTCTQTATDPPCVFEVSDDPDEARYLTEVGFPPGQLPGLFRGSPANCNVTASEDGYLGSFPAVRLTPGMKACDFIHYFDETGGCAGDLWKPTCPQPPTDAGDPPDDPSGEPKPTPTAVPKPVQDIAETDNEPGEIGDTGIVRPDPEPPEPSGNVGGCGSGTTVFCLTMMIDERSSAPPEDLPWYFYDAKNEEFVHFELSDGWWTLIETWGGQDFTIVAPPGYRLRVSCEGDSAADYEPEVGWVSGDDFAKVVAENNGSTYANCFVRHDAVAIDLSVSICGLPDASYGTGVSSRICVPHVVGGGAVTAIAPAAPQPLRFTVSNVGGRELTAVLVEKQTADAPGGWEQVCDMGSLDPGAGASCTNDDEPNLTSDRYRAVGVPDGAREVVLSPDLTGKIVDNRTNDDPFNTVCYSEPGAGTDLICVPIIRGVPDSERVEDFEEILVHDARTPILNLQTYEMAKTSADGSRTVSRTLSVANESPAGIIITELEIYIGSDPILTEWCEPIGSLASGEFIKCVLGDLPLGPELVAATGVPRIGGKTISGYERVWDSDWINPGLAEATMVIIDDTETVLSSPTTQHIAGWVEFVGVDIDRVAGFATVTTDDLTTRCILKEGQQAVLCSLDLDGVRDYPVPFSLGIEAVLVAEDDGESIKTWADSIEISPLIPGLGDVNCSGSLSTADAQAILSYNVGNIGGGESCEDPGNSIYLPVADTNADGAINTLDALNVLRCDEGISTPGICP